MRIRSTYSSNIMEQKRPSKREHHIKSTHPSQDQHTSRSHQHGSRSRYRVAEDPGRSKPGQADNPPPSLAQPELSGDNDYVRNWLAQTSQNDTTATRKSIDGQERWGREYPAARPAQNNLQELYHRDIEDQPKQSKGKRRHRSSSDSSLLHQAPNPASPPPRPRDVEHPGKQRRESSSRLQKRRKPEPSDSGNLDHSEKYQETFEKRARHKTREDRYEPKKERYRGEKGYGEKKSKKKREKRGDRMKTVKKAGLDLMNNFSSKSIGQDRLTIRLSRGPGLFKNGRASSPAKRRGLPDLAFSEMEFLQRTSRDHRPNKENESSWKEKGKRKSVRTQEEISTFFRPARAALKEVSSIARAGKSSTSYMSDDMSIYGRQGGNNDQNQFHTAPKIMDILEKPFLGFGRSAPSSHRHYTPRRMVASENQSSMAPGTTSRSSGKPGTFVTWSESQFSPRTTSKGLDIFDGRRGISPTPDFVRRSIEETGIFKDTGISTFEKERHRDRDSPRREHGQQEHSKSNATTDISTTSDETTISADSSTLEKAIESSQRPPPRSRVNKSIDSLPNQDDRNKSGVARQRTERSLSNIETTESPKGDGKVNIEQYDLELGWHRRRNSAFASDLRARASQDQATNESKRIHGVTPSPKSTPLDRGKLAQTLRIKRPSTAVPIIQAMHGKVTDGAQDGEVMNKQKSPSERQECHDLLQSSSAKSIQPAIQGRGLNLRSEVPLHGNQELASMPVNTLSGIQQNRAISTFPRQDIQPQGTERPEISRLGGNLTLAPPIMQPDALQDLNSAISNTTMSQPTVVFWIPRSQGNITQPNRLSPIAEVAPLYANQMQQNHYLQEPQEPQDHDDIDNIFRQPVEYVQDLAAREGSAYLEEIEHGNFLEDRGSLGSLEADGNFDPETSPYEYFAEGELGMNQEGYLVDAGTWQHIDQLDGQELEEHDATNALGQEFLYEQPTADVAYAAHEDQDFHQAYGTDVQGYEEPINEHYDPGQGFWRSLRRY